LVRSRERTRKQPGLPGTQPSPSPYATPAAGARPVRRDVRSEMKIEMTEEQVDDALGKIQDGLRKYCWIQANFQECDVSKDHGFQIRFNDFYKVRRDAKWRDCYYRLMQNAKQDGITFPEVLHALADQTKRIEASFTSKLMATLDPTKPIIDRFVLENFGLRLPSRNTINRESKTVDIYNQLCINYGILMSNRHGRMICDKFKQRYPFAEITDLKKLDLGLWQIRGRKT
jgi:hypothetical protein